MGIETLLGVIISPPKNLVIHFDDCFADKLSHRITCGILLFFAIFVSTKQFAGEPIKCWVPKHFSDNHVEYTNEYCWIRNTYYLPFQEHIPKEDEENEHKHIVSYYQWVSFILATQALLFHLPKLLWRTMNKRSGIDIGGVIQSNVQVGKLTEKKEKDTEGDKKGANTFSLTTSDGKLLWETTDGDPDNERLKYEEACKLMFRYLESLKERDNYSPSLSFKNIFSKTMCRCCGREQGNYLIALFLFCKILYILNLVLQILAINYLLGFNFANYGLDVIMAMVRDEDWPGSENFPRVTMCDLKILRLGNVQRYTVQCVLSVNLFNEKIYLFLWFWFIFVLIISIVSFFSWIRKSSFSTDRHRFIRKNLKQILKGQTGEVKKQAAMFTNFLGEDGVFILRLLEHNSDQLTSYEFVNDLFVYYIRNKTKGRISSAQLFTALRYTMFDRQF